MSRILLATDGSAHAAAALDVAAALARRDGASTLVVHVVTGREPSEAARRAVEVEFADELIERSRPAMRVDEARDEATLAKLILSRQGSIARTINAIIGESILERAASALGGHEVAQVETRLVDGDPAERLLAIAAEEGFDTIVMGSHGHGRLEGIFMGSVSQAVAHHARCRVVTVRGAA